MTGSALEFTEDAERCISIAVAIFKKVEGSGEGGLAGGPGKEAGG